MSAWADIGHWFEVVANRYPARVAVIDGEEQITFAELLTRVDRLGHAFASMGLRPGCRIGLLARNCPGFIVAYLAIARFGACAVLLNVRWTASELEYALSNAEVKALIYDEALSLTVKSVIERRTTAVLICIGSDTNIAGSKGLATLIAEADPVPRHHRLPDPERPLMILYTSGTTGSPKGAVLTHSNVAWATFGIIRDNGYTPPCVSPCMARMPARSIVVLPLYHVAGLQLQALPHLLAGGSIVLIRTSDPMEVAEEAIRTRATSTYLIRFQWRSLAETVLTSGLPRASSRLQLRQMIVGGGPVDSEVFALARRFGACLTFTMGMTEAGPQIFRMSHDELHVHNGALGRCSWYIDANVVGNDGKTVPSGAVGELVVRGPTVTNSYLSAEGAPEPALHGGWFRTGDLVTRSDDGLYVFVDRTKDMIRTGGENVYAAEVERVVGSMPEIARVAVVGEPHPKWGEAVKAYVVLRPGYSATAQSIIERARKQLAGYKCPRSVQFVATLPLTDLERVRKGLLRRR